MDIRLQNSEQLINMIFARACCSARHRAGMLIRARLIIPAVKKCAALIMSEVPSVACRYPSKASQYHLGKEFRSRSRGLRTFTKFSGETFDDEVRAYGNVERDECRQARSEDSDERHRCGEDGSCPNVPGYRCEHSLFWLRAECVRSRT